MKKKLVLLLLVVVFAAPSMMAQLTKGSTSANVVRTGNRAKAGDYGLYFGLNTGIFNTWANPYMYMEPIPLVNLKYMHTNNLEFRVGLELTKISENLKGVDDNGTDALGVKSTYANVDHLILPGIAYHFSNTNLLDVYVGAELPIGYTRFKSYDATNDEKDYTKVTQTSFNIGVGGFIGLQAYIGNLPLALGLEYGISWRTNLMGKQKSELKTDGNDAVISYSYDPADFTVADLTIRGGSRLSELKNASNGVIGNQIRLTITYFFNK